MLARKDQNILIEQSVNLMGGPASYIPAYQDTRLCRAAKEAGAPHYRYIDRKKENVIFTL